MVRAITRRANGLMEGRRVIKGLEESSLKGLESSLSERRTRAGSSQTGCPRPGPEQAPDEVLKGLEASLLHMPLDIPEGAHFTGKLPLFLYEHHSYLSFLSLLL